MPSKMDHNTEFVEPWAELREKMREPGFDVEDYLAKKSGVLTANTIRELRIATKVGGALGLGEDYDRWEEEEQAQGNRRRRFWASFNRTGWAAAAVLLVIFCGLPVFGENEFKDYPAHEELSNEIIDIFLHEGQFNIEAPNFFERLVHNHQIRWIDIDGDEHLEIIVASNGRVLCMEHDGSFVWKFELSQADLEDSFIEGPLKKTVEFLKSNSNVMDSDGKFESAHYDLDSPGRIWLDQAWERLARGLTITDIRNFDGDDDPEILVEFRGALLVLDHNGTRQDVEINGRLQKHIVLLDGSLFCGVQAIADVYDGDNEEDELIIYKSTSFALTSVQGEPIRGEDGYYTYGTKPGYDGEPSVEPYHDRGIYVATLEGEELWHLNLPFHSTHVTVCDYDNDGMQEIIIDTYTPNNGYLVNYGEEFRNIVGYNFKWESYDWALLPTFEVNGQEFPYMKDWAGDIGAITDEIDEEESAFIIFGMEGDQGTIEELLLPRSFTTYTYLNSRYIEWEESSRLYSVQYTDLPVGDEDFFHKTYLFDSGKLNESDYITGSFPEMRYYDALFGLDTPNGPVLTMGMSPIGQLNIYDEYFIKIGSYSPTGEPDPDHREDVIIYDVADLNGDGYTEILVGFGTLHAPWETEDQDLVSVVRILTVKPDPYNPDQVLSPFFPDLGWDSYEVSGPVIKASFNDIDGNGLMDILIMSDNFYYFTQSKKFSVFDLLLSLF